MQGDLPIVAIIGRRNVGKSTLFNSLIRERKAIVDSYSGLTRDVINYTVRYLSRDFILSDTPGLDLEDSSELNAKIIENTKNFLKRATVLVLLMENPAPSAFDLDLADMIRKLGKPSIIAVNKMDGERDLENMTDFYEVGLGDILPISALNRINLGLLLEKIAGFIQEKKSEIPEPDLKIAIVGRPNSGKSTLLNAYLGYERALVSEIPGTTRDAIDELFTYHKKIIRIVDTAGIRRKSRIQQNIEYYSLDRTVESIGKSDVVVHLIDGEEGLAEADKKIADEILRAGKPLIIAINKWDLVPRDTKTFDRFKDRLIFKFYRAADFPIISISAKNRQRIDRLIRTAMELHEKASLKIDTRRLNRFLGEILRKNRPPELGSALKISFATQTGTSPPRFKLFVNNPGLVRKDTLRFLEKTFQNAFGMNGVPVVFQIESKYSDEKK